MSRSRKPRRGHGEGSIYWRADRQRYCGQVEVAGRRRTIYGKTKAEVQQKMLKARLDGAQGRVAPSATMTVEQLLTDWLREAVEPKGRGRTYESYEYHSRCHLIPALGTVKLRDLTTAQLQRLYRQLLDRGLSLKTVRNAHGVLRAALRHAVEEWKLVPVNVAQPVRLPQYVPPEHETLSPAEVQQVWQQVAGTRWHAFLVLLVMTGLRQGEILGLKWADLDWSHRILQLRRQLQRDKTFQPTKGRRNRRLDLSELELAALRDHRALQDEDKRRYGERYEDHDLIFCTHRGRPLGWRVVDRDFARILRRAGVKAITFHESRHTYATLALKHGIPAKVVQERLGHSDVAVTLNIYSHVTPGLGQQAVERMHEILGEKSGETRDEDKEGGDEPEE